MNKWDFEFCHAVDVLWSDNKNEQHNAEIIITDCESVTILLRSTLNFASLYSSDLIILKYRIISVTTNGTLTWYPLSHSFKQITTCQKAMNGKKKKKNMRKTYTYACHQAGLQRGIESSIKEDWYAVQFTIIVKTLDKINNTCMFKIIGMTLFPGTLAL